MLKNKRRSDQNMASSSLAREPSNLLARLRNKPFVHRVTLKLVSNEIQQTSRSNKNSKSRSSNLCSEDQSAKTTPTVKDFYAQNDLRSSPSTGPTSSMLASRNKVNNSPKPTTNNSFIKTYIRFRPLSGLERELSPTYSQAIKFQKNTSICVNSSMYTFDRVFMPEDSQTKVFEDTTKQLITKVLEGYNATLFTYGQTGSGKSFTMFGDHRKGIIPIAVAELFGKLNPENSQISCSVLQIYKQVLIDLMRPEKTELKIKQTSLGIQVAGLTSLRVFSEEETLEFVAKANQAKKIRQTSLNDHSSRSHFILTLTVEQTKPETGELVRSKINLIDLAGSQKVAKSKTQGEGLEQAKKINLSLSCLGNTIHAIVKGHDHIPFRESKLTRLLQDSLVGNCYTSLIVTCSLHQTCLQQTVGSLKFASRVKCVKTTPVPNVLKNGDQSLVQRRLYSILKQEHEQSQEKLERVRQLVEDMKKNHQNPVLSKYIGELQEILQGPSRLYCLKPFGLSTTTSKQSLQKSRSQLLSHSVLLQSQDASQKMSLDSHSQHPKVLVEKTNSKLKQLAQNLKKHQMLLADKQLQIARLTKRNLELQSRKQSIDSLKATNTKLLLHLQNQKDSYYAFEKQILQQQIRTLMDRLCSTDPQAHRLEESTDSQLLNVQNQHIRQLEVCLAGFIKALPNLIKYIDCDFAQKGCSPEQSQKDTNTFMSCAQTISKLIHKKQSIEFLIREQKTRTMARDLQNRHQIQAMQAQICLMTEKIRHLQHTQPTGISIQ